MSLRIAYISDERFPSIHTDTQQVVKTIDALGRSGVHVDLIQPRMMRHLTASRDEVKRQICEFYNVEGHFHLRDLLLWPASDMRIEKFFHGLAAPLKGLSGNYDVFYTRNVLPLAMATFLRLPVLFETYRALPHTDPAAWRVVKRMAAARSFVGISTHSAYSRGVMMDAGIPADRIEAIPNGFDPGDFADLPDQVEARRLLNLSGADRIAVYTGHIRRDKGVHSLLDMAEEYPDMLMLIVGGNPKETAALQATVDDRRLRNVRLTGQVPISKVPLYLAAADVLVLPPSALPLTHSTVLPIKTFTYMAAGRPILAPDLPDTAGVLEDGVNALKVAPDNAAAAVAGLRRLLDDPGLARRLADAAKSDARKFTWAGRAAHLRDFITRRLEAIHRP